ncbi:MAG: GMC oxidoreductase [Acidimicrobiales bacterium]
MLVTALAARSGERRDAATVYLDGAPDGLALVTDTVITSLDQPDLSAFDHLVISAGALASPPLVAAIEAGVRPTVGQQHLAVALPVPLPPALQTERDQPAVTRVLRWASGLGDGLPGASAVHSDGRGDEPVDVLERSRADLQLVVLDHMGWDAAGRGQGLVLVSLLSGSELGRATTEPDRARLRLGVRRALDLIAAAGVEAAVDLTIDADDAAIDSWVAIQPNPVHHVTSTLPLGTHVGPAGLVNGRRDRSVIDASVLPVSPRADTNMAVMVMADLLATQLITHLA